LPDSVAVRRSTAAACASDGSANIAMTRHIPDDDPATG
jgi:hypothetical protein